MWFSSALLLLFVATFGVMADVEDDVEMCIEGLNFDEEDLLSSPDNDDLKTICSTLLGAFECVNGVLEEATGFTAEQMLELLKNTEFEGPFRLYVNTQNLLRDFCDEDSQIHKDYIESEECYARVIDTDAIKVCERQAATSYSAFKELEDKVQEEADESVRDDNAECIRAAYLVACAGALIKEECDQKAFDTYTQIIRRTTMFRYGICSEDQMEFVKNQFLDSLEMETPMREIYRLALDLKKRRRK